MHQNATLPLYRESLARLDALLLKAAPMAQIRMARAIVRLCQYAAAAVSETEFRSKYGRAKAFAAAYRQTFAN